MNLNIERAQLLFQQSRYELAEAELRQALGVDPHDAYAHALLSLCLSDTKRFKEATESAQQAIHLLPDLAFAHYALAYVFYKRDCYPEAQAAIEEAIRLETDNVAYFALLAGIHLDQKRWQEALLVAEQGLQMDSEHIGCTNLRAMALVKLGRKTEAGATIDAALAKSPDNSITHANQGWTYLEKGEPKKALEHFREALRLDPTNQWARSGIIEALKARNIVYALMLKYFLWMAKLDRRTQWMIILGGFFGNRVLAGMAHSNPEIAPWVLPLRILYVTFVVLSWTSYPMFNLLLRLNRFGRLALTPEQITETNWVGACFFLALASLCGCIAIGIASPWLMSLAVFGLLLLPLSGLFRCSVGWPRWVMIAVVSVLFLLGVGAIIPMWQAYLGGDRYVKSTADIGLNLLGLFSMGVLGSTFLVNFLAGQRPRR